MSPIHRHWLNGVRLDFAKIANRSKCIFNWTEWSNKSVGRSVHLCLPYSSHYHTLCRCVPPRRENHFLCDVMSCNKYPFIASIFVWIGYLPALASFFCKLFSHYTFAFCQQPTALAISSLCLHADKLNEMLACSSAVYTNQPASSYFE